MHRLSSTIARHSGPVALAGVVSVASSLASAQSVFPIGRQLSRDDYADRLRAMWLGECIANWTGLQTEGVRIAPPFYTDADWGHSPDGRLIDFVIQDPWWADDDTDVEYVYLHLMSQAGRTLLTPQEIGAGWTAHINRFIWVSDANARVLIGRGTLPPATSLGTANWARLEIDAQLTTEMYGAMCPGMPEEALRLSELPVCTTATGFAAHAAQFYIALYSLATQVDPALSPRDQAVWLVQQARRYIPDSSKSADIADFVLTDFLANPDINNWESTRDKVYLRYHGNAAANGFTFRGWFESSVNFASGLMALLYGNGDFRRTVQIGALSGWDSDNGTATMGGLFGLMHGTQAIRDQFPGVPLSDRFWIGRTRDNLPDRLPGDAAADDTLTLMAGRLVPLVEQTITARNGLVDAASGRWLLPPVPVPGVSSRLVFNPLSGQDARSQNNAVRRAGGAVVATAPSGNPGPNRGWGLAAAFANGAETDFSGVDRADADWPYFSSEAATGVLPGNPITLQVVYDRPVSVHTVRFIEGDHFDGTNGNPSGGYFTSGTFQVLIGGTWVTPAGAPSEPFDAARPFQIIDFVLSAPVLATGIRLTGMPGGPNAFVTCSELDAMAAPAGTPPSGTFDMSHDGAVGIEDLYSFFEVPADLDGDGSAGAPDARYLETAVRFNERTEMVTPR